MTALADQLLARADDPKPGLLAEDRVVEWRSVVEEVRARAALALALRRPGPFHIGVMLENVPDFVYWLLSTAFSGATVVGVNTTRRGGQLAADIRHTDCQLLVTSDGLRGLLDHETPVAADRMLSVDSADYARVVDEHRGRDVAAAVDESAPALLMFTSGSTGAPKAVICSHARLAATGPRSAEHLGILADDVLYESMPLFHGNAVFANLAPALALGATVALRPTFSASAFLADVRRYGATYFNYVGRALAYVLATPEQPDDAHNPLRLGFGTEASARDREVFERRFGCRLIESYGSSEGVISMARPPGTPDAALGVPNSPTMDVAVLDPETGAECPRAQLDATGRLLNPEAVGELVNRAGVGTFEGYYRNEAATAERIRDGVYWTGDLAYRDADGWFYFAGRSSDWLRVDSENFAAAPVETILLRHPDVVMAAVYAVPDPRTGDQVMAALELRDGASFDAAAVAEFLGGQRDLGTKWAPRFVRVVASMPLTGTHKVDKAPLRRDGWRCADPVWWRPGRELAYRPFTPADAADLTAAFAAAGRSHVLEGS